MGANGSVVYGFEIASIKSIAELVDAYLLYIPDIFLCSGENFTVSAIFSALGFFLFLMHSIYSVPWMVPNTIP